jgi:hypothetical protein
MNNRRMLPGCHEPTAEAPGEATADPINLLAESAGSPLVTVAAGATVRAAPPSSRRVYARAVHANGATPGSPLSPPAPNHASTPAPTPRTPPDAAAARGAVRITGPAVAVVASGDESDEDRPDDGVTTEPETVPTTASEGAVTGVASTRVPRCTPAGTDTAEPGCGRGPFAIRDSAVSDPPSPCEPAGLPGPGPVTVEPPRDRAAPREGALVDAGDEPARESAVFEPVEPAEPVVSANATGIATTAEPTPNATANAPTRPTYRAQLVFTEPKSATGVDGRPDSMVRTHALAERRMRPTERPFASGTGHEAGVEDDKETPQKTFAVNVPQQTTQPEPSGPSVKLPNYEHVTA